MTDKQQPPNPPMPTLEEIGGRWGIVYNQALAANIVLENQLAAQAKTIRQLTANETTLVENAEDLEADLADLKTEVFDLRQEVKSQRAEVQTLQAAADNAIPAVEVNAGGKIAKAAG